MDKSQLQELKTFMKEAVSESEERLRVEMRESLKNADIRFEKISDEMQEGFTEMYAGFKEMQEGFTEMYAGFKEMREGFTGVAVAFEELDKTQAKTNKILAKHTEQLDRHGEQILQLKSSVA